MTQNTETQKCFVKTKSSQKIVYDWFRVNYTNGKPVFVYPLLEEGLSPFAIYDFALTYDDMVKKLVKSKKRKLVLSSNKDAYLDFIENKTIGTKIWEQDPYDKSQWLEYTWDGEFFSCGKHLFLQVRELLNGDFYFQKPEGVNPITDWTMKNHFWCDKLKSWVPNK